MNYTELSEDIVEYINGLIKKTTIPTDLKIKFVANEKQKQVVLFKKIPDVYSYLLESELLVSVNESLFDAFTEDLSKEILFSQEIDKIQINLDTGKVKMKKPDLNTFSGIVSKYGIEKVARANQVEELTVSQKEDKEGFIA